MDYSGEYLPSKLIEKNKTNKKKTTDDANVFSENFYCCLSCNFIHYSRCVRSTLQCVKLDLLTQRLVLFLKTFSLVFCQEDSLIPFSREIEPVESTATATNGRLLEWVTSDGILVSTNDMTFKLETIQSFLSGGYNGELTLVRENMFVKIKYPGNTEVTTIELMVNPDNTNQANVLADFFGLGMLWLIIDGSIAAATWQVSSTNNLIYVNNATYISSFAIGAVTTEPVRGVSVHGKTSTNCNLRGVESDGVCICSSSNYFGNRCELGM